MEPATYRGLYLVGNKRAKTVRAVQIVDRFHAKQHLANVGKVIWGPESQIGKDWLVSATYM